MFPPQNPLGYVRQDEYWPEDSPEYKAGNAIENRKKPPRQELPGDMFDRQRAICGFDQGLIERQVCLVLGSGGVGQDTALALGRLGVARIILVDNDTLEASNLSRQCLSTRDQVGMRKVDAAAATLRDRGFSLRSKVDAHHLDAVHQWPEVVSLAMQSDVIFNCIDVGALFDAALNGLSLELGIPLVQGQSFAWTACAELYSGCAGSHCLACDAGPPPPSLFGLTSPRSNSSSIGGRGAAAAQRLQAWLSSSEDHEILEVDGEACPSVAIASFLCIDPAFRLGHGLPKPSTKHLPPPSCSTLAAVRAAMTKVPPFARKRRHETASGATDRPYEVDPTAAEAFLGAYREEVLAALLPGRVSALPDLGLIPRPKPIDTRMVGSWVCPALLTGALMVSQWTSLLTSPVEPGAGALRSPARTVTLDLKQGTCSSSSDSGGVGGDVYDASSPYGPNNYVPGCREPSNPICAPCAAAKQLKALDQLYFGTAPVWLVPAPGSVQRVPPQHGWHKPPPLQVVEVSPEEGSGNGSTCTGEGDERAKAMARAAAECAPWSAAVYGEPYANVVMPGLCATPIDPIMLDDDDGNKDSEDEENSGNHEDGKKKKVDGESTSLSEKDARHSNLSHAGGNGHSTTIKKRSHDLLNNVDDRELSPSATSTATVSATGNDLTAAAGAGNEMPPALGYLPMLKLPFAAARAWPSSLEGVASGARSAVVRLKGSGGGVWYRLKGCGNHEQGFPVEAMGVHPSTGAPTKSVRGCVFQQTAQREACLTYQVAYVLRQHHLPCGNDPSAVYQCASPPPSAPTPSSGEGAAQDTSATRAGEGAATSGSTAATTVAGAVAVESGEGGGGALAGAWESIAWDLPKVTRYCGVFRTKGDRRLGDHLLGGLELLLKDIWPLNARELWQLAHEINTRRGLVVQEESSGSSHGVDGVDGDGSFKSKPPRDGDWGVMTTDMLPFLADPPPPPADLSEFTVATERAPPRVATDENGLQAHVLAAVGGVGENSGGAEDTASFALPGGEAGLTSAGCAVAQRLGVAPLFARLWNDAIDVLETATAVETGAEAGVGAGARASMISEYNTTTSTVSPAAAVDKSSQQQNAGSTSAVLLLAWRLGYECGRVQFLLRSNGISWGTYPDSMGTHCNAHANNMVVLPPQKRTNAPKDAAASGASNATPPTSSPTLPPAETLAAPPIRQVEEPCFLAPVDFDMAFTQASYLPELATAACPGFDADWSAVMALEAEGFYGTLAGSDFASTGVANHSHRAQTADPGDPRRIALRDTLCSGFRKGLAGARDPRETSFLQRKTELDALVRLCLVVTAGDIA